MTLFSIGTILIVLNIFISYKGFKDHYFFEKYSFKVDAVSLQKDYKRLITSGFLHVSWTHLIFNMFFLFFFSGGVENYIGPFNYLLIYTSGLVGGNLLSLFIHRHSGGYSSVGASGAIFAVVFSSIALFPGMSINLLFLVPIPGWLFGVVYMLVSIYGIKSGTDNIGHDAHLGGGLTGMLVAVLLYPSLIFQNAFTLLIVAVPAIVFILFIIYKPEALLIDNYFFKKSHHLTVETSTILAASTSKKRWINC